MKNRIKKTPAKMTALKPFLFRGAMLAVDDELQPDNEEQATLLKTIGLAEPRRRGYGTRAVQHSPNAAVMTAAVPQRAVLHMSSPTPSDA